MAARSPGLPAILPPCGDFCFIRPPTWTPFAKIRNALADLGVYLCFGLLLAVTTEAGEGSEALQEPR
jgi:hypothetical protein